MQHADSNPALPNAYMRLKTSLFGCLHVAQKDAGHGSFVSAAELSIKLAQLLTFVFADASDLNWRSGSTSGFTLVLGLTTINGYAQWMSTQAFLALFYFSMVWVALFTLLFCYGCVCFAKGSFPYLWPLKLLRAVGSTSTTGLYIPMLTLLLAGFRCTEDRAMYVGKASPGSNWLEAQYDCQGVGYLIQSVITGILVVLFFGLCVLWTACVQDRHPMSKSQGAKAHGLVDTAVLLGKTLLVILIKGWPQEIVPAAAIAVLMAVALTWTTGSILYLPYYSHSMNRANAAAGMVMTWAVLCLATAQGYRDFDAAVAWYLGLAFAALAGVALADRRADWLLTCPLTSLSSPYDIDLRARFLLHQALYGHATKVLPVQARQCVQEDGPVGDSLIGVKSSSDGSGSGPRKHPVGPSEVGVLQDDLTELEQEEDMDTRVVLAQKVLTHISAHARARGTTDPVVAASSVYAYGLSKLRSSARMHLFVSRYHQAYTGNKHLQMTHLLQAGRRRAGVDVHYAVFTTRRALEESAATAHGPGSAGQDSVPVHPYHSSNPMHGAGKGSGVNFAPFVQVARIGSRQQSITALTTAAGESATAAAPPSFFTRFFRRSTSASSSPPSEDRHVPPAAFSIPSSSGGTKESRRAAAWAVQQHRLPSDKSRASAIKLLAVTTLPLLILLLVLVGSLVEAQARIGAMQSMLHAAVASHQRFYTVRAAYTALRRGVRQFTSPSGAAADLAVARSSVGNLRYLSSLYLAAPLLSPADKNSLPYSAYIARAAGMGAGRGQVGLDESKQSIIADVTSGSRLCSLLWEGGHTGDYFPSQAACELFPAGRRSTQAGLAQVEEDWAREMLRLADRRATATVFNATSGVAVLTSSPTNATVPYRVLDEFLSMATLDALTEAVILPAYLLQADVYEQASIAEYSSFVSFQTAFLAAGLTLYVIMLYAVYGWYLVRMNSRIRKQRGLLLLLPPQVLEVPAGTDLRTIVSSTLSEMGISTSGTSVTAGAGR